VPAAAAALADIMAVEQPQPVVVVVEAVCFLPVPVQPVVINRVMGMLLLVGRRAICGGQRYMYGQSMRELAQLAISFCFD
jgi:hypothetical protein